MEENIDVNKVSDIKSRSGNKVVQSLASEILETEKLKSGVGDEVSTALIELTKVMSNQGKGADIQEVERIVNERLKDYKISISNLDPSIMNAMNQSQSVNANIVINTPSGSTKVNRTISPEIFYPQNQLLLSDLQARNNSYLYGGAGTGKTYSAKIIAEFMGWEQITLECNQFTSKLDILGGQTIDGYQKGKLEMAWENKGENNQEFKGCVLLLDELPKLDPNTAGILNGALAKVKEVKVDSKGNIKKPTIENGRNQKLEMGNIFIIATGNSKLNEANKDYEANFKQDLSLQDRFAGSTYQIFMNMEMVWNEVMQRRFAFLYIGLDKLRKAIDNNMFQNRAFVSTRLFLSLRDTWMVYLDKKATFTTQNGEGVETNVLTDKKTIKQGLDSFLSLFGDEQITTLKEEMGYDEFIATIRSKEKLSISDMDTQAELDEVQRIISEYRTERSERVV